MTEERTGGEQNAIAIAYEFASTCLSEDEMEESKAVLPFAKAYASTNTQVTIEQLVWLIHGHDVDKMVAAGIARNIAYLGQKIAQILTKVSDLESVSRLELDDLSPPAYAVLCGYTDRALDPGTLRQLDENRKNNVLMGFGPLRQELIARMDEHAINSRIDQVLTTVSQFEQRQDQLEQLLSQTVMAVNEISSTIESLVEQIFADTDEDAKEAFREEVKRRQREVLEHLSGQVTQNQ